MKKIKSMFTLIELLVVITIISILATMLLPALKSARSTALGANCVSNLKQHHLWGNSYANDNNDFWIMTGSDGGHSDYGNNCVFASHFLAMTGYAVQVKIPTPSCTRACRTIDPLLGKAALCRAEYAPQGPIDTPYGTPQSNYLKADYYSSTGFMGLCGCDGFYSAKVIRGAKIDLPGILPVFFDTICVLSNGTWKFANNLGGSGQYLHARHSNQILAACMDGHVQQNPVKAFIESKYKNKFNSYVLSEKGALLPPATR